MEFKLWLMENWERFGHQKTFSFLREPENPFQKDASSLLSKDDQETMEESGYKPDKLYHVTTNLPAIKRDMMLKSREESGSIGLGGGPSNMSPTLVSLTYNYSRALEIYEGFKFVCNIISGQFLASDIYDYMSGMDDNHFNGDEEELSKFEEVLNDYGVPEEVLVDGDEEKIKVILNKNISTPKERYEFFQSLENSILDENDIVQKVIGFTAPFNSIKSLKLQNIAIIQVAIRKNADIEHYGTEAEIRVSSKDLAIIRYMKP